MPKVSRRGSSSRPQRRSSRPARYEDPLVRIHRVRRKMTLERKRLGLSPGEYLEYIAKENEKAIAEFKRKRGIRA